MSYMRITNNMITRKYISHLNRNLGAKNESENKISSNRQYTRASQNPISAAKAMQVRKTLADTDVYTTNLKNAKNIYETAEGSIMSISSLIQNTYENLIYGANGTQSEDEDKILADTIDQYADEMMRIMNTSVADRHLFGGTNNETNAFEIKDSGGSSAKTVYYNGVEINAYQDPAMFPYGSTSYVDIGVGMYANDDGTIAEQSAFPVTFNGASLLGCGLNSSVTEIDMDDFLPGSEYSFDVTLGSDKKTVIFEAGSTAEETAENFNEAAKIAFTHNYITMTEYGIVSSSSPSGKQLTVMNSEPVDNDDDGYDDYETIDMKAMPKGYSNNIIQLTLDAAECLRSGDKQGAARYADVLFASQTHLSLTIADIGNKEEFIDFNLQRNVNNEYSLDERQNDLEFTDLGTEITNFKVLEAVYNATMQMGASALPMSIFNFIN